MRIALGRYQAERDRLALPMHPIVDRLASHQWDLTQVQQLLRGLSSVMEDDVEVDSGRFAVRWRFGPHRLTRSATAGKRRV